MPPPLPASLADKVLAEWLDGADEYTVRPVSSYVHIARAVRALVEAKVREAVTAAQLAELGETTEEVVARVMGAP